MLQEKETKYKYKNQGSMKRFLNPPTKHQVSVREVCFLTFLIWEMLVCIMQGCESDLLGIY